MRRWLLVPGLLIGVFFVPLGVAVGRYFADDARATDWRTAPRAATGQAPAPATTPEAVVQVYAARAFGWRGALGVHTWIAVKPQHAPAYTRLEVVGWGVRSGGDAVRVREGAADAQWYGSRPRLLRELRGRDDVDAVIDRLLAAAASYPYRDTYRMWPGPNSNTFVAHLGRAAPELALDLPPTAIGKDFLPDGALVARAPSGAGMQLSLAGLLGVTLAPQEGLELNLLGLSAGIDVSPPALKLPGLGRLGSDEVPRP